MLLSTLAAPAGAQSQRSMPASPDQTRLQVVAAGAPVDVNSGATPRGPPAAPAPSAGPPPRIVVEEPLRWGVDFRFGYGVPFGNIFDGQSLSAIAPGLYDLEGAADVVIFRRWVVGAHIGAGIAWDFDLGIHGEYRFLLPTSKINPWLGLGLSYEILRGSEEKSPSDLINGHFSGADVDLSGGCDFSSGPLGWGPFITYRVGRYTSGSESETTDEDGATSQLDVRFNAFHSWLLLGVRIRY